MRQYYTPINRIRTAVENASPSPVFTVAVTPNLHVINPQSPTETKKKLVPPFPIAYLSCSPATTTYVSGPISV